MISIEDYSKLHKNYLWYLEHYNELYLEYGKCYLVIVDCHVVGYRSTLAGANYVAMSMGLHPGTFIIQDLKLK